MRPVVTAHAFAHVRASLSDSACADLRCCAVTRERLASDVILNGAFFEAPHGKVQGQERKKSSFDSAGARELLEALAGNADKREGGN